MDFFCFVIGDHDGLIVIMMGVGNFCVNLRFLYSVSGRHLELIGKHNNIRKRDANPSSTSTTSATPWTDMMGNWTGHQWNTKEISIPWRELRMIQQFIGQLLKLTYQRCYLILVVGIHSLACIAWRYIIVVPTGYETSSWSLYFRHNIIPQN